MLRPLLIAATALLAVIPAAHGQSAPLTKAESNLAFSALGHTLTFPYPEWIDEAGQAETDPLPLFEVTNSDDGTKAEVDLLPKGESKADWLHHYEARIVLMPERSLEQLRSDVMLELSQSCKRELVGFFQFSEDVEGAPPVLGYACGGYLDSISGLAGRGEVAIVAFKRTDKGLGMVMEQWRGPAFELSGPTTWPVATDIVEERAELLSNGTVLTVAE